MNTFYGVRRLPPYVFEPISRLRESARARGLDVIDLGMGNPDLATPHHIVEKMLEAIRHPRVSRYSASKGIIALRKAQARYYDRRFGVKLAANSQVVVTLGSKEGFANMARALTSPGDVILTPNPSYPIHSFGFLMAGGVVRSLPAEPDDRFISALDRSVRNCVPKPIAVVVNYPANPTANTATLEFYKDLVTFARHHGLFVLSDLAYAEIYFDQCPPPPSILQVPGAVDCAVEFTSVSKTYSMPGWRIGFAVGNERLLAALTRVKSYLDYGAFTPIQVAACAALDGPEDSIEMARRTYQRRRDVLVDSFSRAGWAVPSPQASMFVWAPIPAKYREFGSLEFAKLLLRIAGVAVAPGIGFGENGDGFVRLALVENENRIRQAAAGIKRLFGGEHPQPNELQRKLGRQMQ
jgi:alanine-synthesizing transaminase